MYAMRVAYSNKVICMPEVEKLEYFNWQMRFAWAGYTGLQANWPIDTIIWLLKFAAINFDIFKWIHSLCSQHVWTEIWTIFHQRLVIVSTNFLYHSIFLIVSREKVDARNSFSMNCSYLSICFDILIAPRSLWHVHQWFWCLSSKKAPKRNFHIEA